MLVGIIPNPYEEWRHRMANRKRNIQMKFYVTEEEKRLIDEKMAQLPTRRYGAYLRKMAIDGYIIYTDTTESKAFTSELSVIGRNINQIAKRLNAGDPVYQADMEEIRSIFSCHVEDGVPTDFLYRIHNFRLNKIAARWPAKAVAQFYFY